MPWFVALALIAYGLMLVWQATNILELWSRGLIRGLVLVPFLLLKLAVLLVALGFWDHDFCSILPSMVSRLIVVLGASLLFVEARFAFRLTMFAPQHPPERDNLLIGVEIVLRIIGSAAVLICAGAVAFGSRCAT